MLAVGRANATARKIQPLLWGFSVPLVQGIRATRLPCPGVISRPSAKHTKQILLSWENFPLFLLGPFPSVLLTNSSLWELAKSLEETKDHRRG